VARPQQGGLPLVLDRHRRPNRRRLRHRPDVDAQSSLRTVSDRLPSTSFGGCPCALPCPAFSPSTLPSPLPSHRRATRSEVLHTDSLPRLPLRVLLHRPPDLRQPHAGYFTSPSHRPHMGSLELLFGRGRSSWWSTPVPLPAHQRRMSASRRVFRSPFALLVPVPTALLPALLRERLTPQLHLPHQHPAAANPAMSSHRFASPIHAPSRPKIRSVIGHHRCQRSFYSMIRKMDCNPFPCVPSPK
jgi:hypothetical protein